MRYIEFFLNIDELNIEENYNNNNLKLILKDFFEYCFIKK